MKAILPVFDETRKSPYYLQLYAYLKQAILSGEIAGGERLPSLRNLARSTGLSLTTIEKAYNQLLVEGYIYSKAQSGYYAGTVSKTTEKAPEGGLPLDITVPMEKSISADELLPSDSALLYDPDCFDFNKWKKCMNRVLNEQSSALFFEGSPQGEAALRREISRYLYRSRGFACHPDQVFIAAGTQQITGHLATILRELNIEHVALEDPGYTPVRNMFRDRGFAITDVKVADDGLILENLPANIRTAVYVSPSNHSFTGAVMPIGRRYELIRWAVSNDSYIIEDDYDSELRYFGRPIPPLKSLADDNRVIYLGAFSSTLFAAVKISYMVLPPGIAGRFSLRLPDYSQTCSKLEQLSLAMFMETGLYQTHLRKLRKLYSQKLSRVVEILRRDGSDLVRVQNSASGLSILLEPFISAGDAGTLNKMIGDALSVGIPASCSSNLLLLYYHQIPLDQIEDVLGRLLALWRSTESALT